MGIIVHDETPVLEMDVALIWMYEFRYHAIEPDRAKLWPHTLSEIDHALLADGNKTLIGLVEVDNDPDNQRDNERKEHRASQRPPAAQAGPIAKRPHRQDRDGEQQVDRARGQLIQPGRVPSALGIEHVIQ